MVDTNYLINCLLVSLLRNFSCTSEDSILAFDMITLHRMAHHSMTIYIHFKYIGCFFDIIFGYSLVCFKTLEIAIFTHMMTVYYSSFINNFDYFINHNMNLSFENKEYSLNCFNIRYYFLTFYLDCPFTHQLIQISNL
jgi:hypothetical protein